MSQRLRETLVRKGLISPQIIGWDRLHRPIWGIAGGSEGDPGDGGADDSKDEPDEGEPDDNPDDNPGEGEPDDDGTKDPKDRRSADAERKRREQDEQTRRWKSRIAAADRRASEAERERNRLKAELDQDKPESERLRGELAESEARVTRLQGINRDLALQVAFFRNSKVDWVDPGDAMFIAMRELADLEVDEDGSTDDTEVQKVITRLSKDKPHLVRRSQPKSGAGVGGGKGKDNGAPAGLPAGLVQQFPALRTRVGGQPPSSQ